MKFKTMRMLPVLFLTALTLSLAACQKKEDPAALAAQVALEYYNQLLQGNIEAWVDGHYQPDSIPAEYRNQLIVNARMFMNQQRREHQGIHEVRIVNAKANPAQHTANVFMLFVYGDSTNEETLVPMVENKGVWYMR